MDKYVQAFTDPDDKVGSTLCPPDKEDSAADLLQQAIDAGKPITHQEFMQKIELEDRSANASHILIWPRDLLCAKRITA